MKRMPWKLYREVTTGLLIGIALILSGCALTEPPLVVIKPPDDGPPVVVIPPPDDGPPVVVVDPAQGDLSCEGYCSQFRLRTGGVRLTLGGAAASLPADRLRLDWTVHKTGFAEGAFESFTPLQSGQTPTQSYVTVPNALVASTRGLELTEVQAAAGVVLISVEGLDPGVHYYWRVMLRAGNNWIPGPGTDCAARICPADAADGPGGEQ